MTPQEFSAQIKAKYPQYQAVDDVELARKMVNKYPAYADKVTFEAAAEIPAQAPADVQDGTGIAGFGRKVLTAMASGTPVGGALSALGVDPVGAGASVLKGATLGAYDEALAAPAGAVRSVVTGEPYGVAYEESRKAIEAPQKEFEKESPLTSIAFELVGNIGSPVSKVMAPAGALKKGKTLIDLGKTALQSGVTGAAQGGAYGYFTAEPGERGEAAREGATMGGILGTTVPLGISGIQQSVKYAKAAAADPARRSAQYVQNLFKSAGITPEMLKTKLAEYGDDANAMLADLDPNLQEHLKKITQYTGDVKRTVMDFVNDRYKLERPELMQTIQTGVGGGTADDIYTAVDAMKKAKQVQAGPLYKAAFAKDMPKSRAWAEAWNLADSKAALEAAEGEAARDASRLVFNTRGEAINKPLNEVERFHYAKQVLWKEYETALSAGNKTRANQIRSQWDKVSEALDTIDEYKQARRIYSDISRMEDATPVGNKVLNMPNSDFKRLWGDMGDNERIVARLSFLKAVEDATGKIPDARSIAGFLTDKPGVAANARLVFDNFDDMLKMSEKWKQYRRTQNLINSGNITSKMQDIGEDQGRIAQLTDVADIASDVKDLNMFGAATKLKDFIGKHYGMGGILTPEIRQQVGQTLAKRGLNAAEIDKLFSVIPKPKVSAPYMIPAGIAGVAPQIPFRRED